MAKSRTASSRKSAEAKHLTDTLRSYILAYKGWMEDMLRREKLTLPQMRLLAAVQDGQGQSAASIARTCLVTPQTLQAMLQRAVREKWIVRSHSSSNNRILTATLTARGTAALARGRELAAQLEGEMWSGVGVGSLATCRTVLQRGIRGIELATSTSASSRRKSAR